MVSKDPKVSIILCAYNTANYLEQCIESILSQQFHEWELLLIDDGSTEEEALMCDHYGMLDSRIRVIHKANSGLSDSRNLGIKKAHGNYICFVDSDDWIEPDMLKIMYETIENNGTDIVVVGHWREYQNRHERKHIVNTPKLSKDKALEWILSDRIQSYLWNKMFRSELLVEPMPVGKYYEDYATTYKWFARAESISFIDLPLYHYRKRRGSITNDRNLTHRRIDLFEAAQERYSFALEADMSELGEELLVEKGIKCAKDIVRCGISFAEKKEIVSHIASVIKSHHSAAKRMSIKKQLRFYGICHHPIAFIKAVCLTGYMTRLYKHRIRILYP